MSRSSLSRGARLGSYEIESLLGSGGMGQVYRARDTRLDRTVAVKILPAHVAENPARRRRFETEARAISQINHPHICALYDVGETPRTALVDDGQGSAPGSSPETVPFLVMEYLDGETLAERATRKPLHLTDALQYATQVADALDAAHRQGIVHGDLTPANIMLTRTGVKLLDFGLARLATSDVTDTASDAQPHSATVTVEAVIRGTVPYMAPELLVGGKADVRSDLFAFGAVLYEMLTGRRAFVGDSESAVVAAILESQPAALDATHTTISSPLTNVVTTCLAKDPDERWQSAGDLKRQLAWIAESERAPARAAAKEKSVRGTSWLWRFASILLLTSLALLSFIAFRDRPPASGRVRFQIPPPPNTNFVDLSLRLSPDGRKLAYLTDGGGRRRLWVHSLETGEARPLTGAGFPAVVWSPDSRFLAFSAEGKINRIASDGGSLQTLVDAPGAAHDWSVDDVLLFTQAGVVKRMPGAGGTVTTLTALDPARQEIAHYNPRLLSDGRHFLYLRRSLAEEHGGVYVGSIDARPEEQNLTRLIADAAMAVYVPSSENPRTGHVLFNREGTVLAQRFDAGALQLTGAEIPVAQRVAIEGGLSRAAIFSASANGILAYREAEFQAGTPVWVNREGVESAALVDAPLPEASQVRLSPDGTRLAVFVRGEIWVYDLGGRPAMKLTSHPLGDMLLWSPDGQEIVYSSLESPIRLFSVRVEVGSTPTPVSPLGHYHAHGWSPDGRDLITVLNTYSPNGWDILKLPWRRDAAPEPLVTTSSGDGADGAELSPDGQWLAYTLNVTRSVEVWVRPYAGSTPPVRVSANGGVDPRWSRDGTELYFLENLTRLMVVAVKPGTTFNFTPPRLLFEKPFPSVSVFPNKSYDVAADGRFVMIRPAPSPASPTPITVVLNWASGLAN